jgi:polysaccharide biosynthesis/export protein
MRDHMKRGASRQARGLSSRRGSAVGSVLLATMMALLCVAPSAGQTPLFPQDPRDRVEQPNSTERGKARDESEFELRSTRSNITEVPNNRDSDDDQERSDRRRSSDDQDEVSPRSTKPKIPPKPGEFELYVAEKVGRPIPRFGSSLVLENAGAFVPPTTTAVPPNYVLNPGDTIILGLTGSVESNVTLTIDNEGKIFVPRVGAINLAGVRYGDLNAALARQLGRQYRNFQVSVSVGELRGVTVFVTGYAANPGSYTFNSLSTLSNAVLAAGGPSASGSFRSVSLRRGGATIASLDLYQFILNGDRGQDAILQNNDVIYVGPAGPEVAVYGSVNAEGIFEAKPGETLADIVRFAGGTNSVADTSRLMISRISNLDKTGWEQIDMGPALRAPVERGAILRVLSAVDIARPIARQAILVTIDGEVDRQGHYYLPPGSTLGDLLSKAGGLTPQAYVFGAQVSRESIQRQQRIGFDKAIDDLELALAAAPLQIGRNTTNGVVQLQGANAVLTVLKEREPDGRLTLDIAPDATSLPSDLVLENNDRIRVPPRPTAIGVFGAVYQTGSFVFQPGMSLGDYLTLAGGPKKIGDRGDVFVVRANGAVVSVRKGGFAKFTKLPALPGDVIFIPVKTDRDRLLEKISDIGAIIYQFSLGAAALKVLSE